LLIPDYYVDFHTSWIEDCGIQDIVV